MHDAVGAVEEETLPGLRNALIMATDIEESDLASRAKHLTDMLLIDTQAGGCQQTTRISQAVETIQGLLWSLRTGQLQDTYEDMTLLADNFDEECKWIGSYATWRAALFVFLYPENILLPSLRKEQTPAFRKLVSDLRMNRRMTAEGTCVAAKEYAEYFEDVCTLKVEATCYGETRIHKENRCGTRASAEPTRNLFYMFATGGKTGRIYWSALNPEDELGYPQTFWEAVPGLEDAQVTKIVGSVPYTKTNEQRFIFLFLLVEEGGETKLLFMKRDLVRGGWDVEPGELALPSFSKFSETEAIAVQSGFDEEPPRLVIKGTFIDINTFKKATYFRSMDVDGTDWQGDFEKSDGAEENGTGDEWSGYCIYIDSSYPFNLINLHTAIFVEEPDSPGTPRHLFLCVTRKKSAFSEPELYILHISDMPPHREIEIDDIFISSWCIPQGTWFGALPFLPTGTETMPWTWCIYGKDTVGQLRLVSTKWRITNGPGAFSLASDDIMSRCSNIVPHYGQSSTSVGVSIVFQVREMFTGTGFRLMTYNWDDDGYYQEQSRQSINSKCPPRLIHRGRLTSPFDISEHFSEAELQDRRYLIRHIFRDNRRKSKSIQTYLEEAYYFVPVHLAMQLQRHGSYTDALDWFRTVYDYRALPDRRKISYVLEREDDLSRDYERETDWLLDPLNPHEIAANRRKTYTRFTLLSLVRCFLEYADAEFSFDTAESVPRARTLYTTALELLDEDALKQRISSTCEELIGKLNIEVSNSIPTDEIEYRGLWNGILSGLYKCSNTTSVAGTINAIKRILAEDEPLEMRLNRALGAVNEVVAPASRPMSTVLAGRKEKLGRGRELLLSRSSIAKAVVEIGSSVEKRVRRIPLMLTTEMPELIESETDASDRVEAAVNATGLYEYQPGLSFSFCIPPNPVLEALRLKAELNLYKIRTCRNIAGMERQLDPYAATTDTVSGMPQIGAGGQLVLPGTANPLPIPCIDGTGQAARSDGSPVRGRYAGGAGETGCRALPGPEGEPGSATDPPGSEASGSTCQGSGKRRSISRIAEGEGADSGGQLSGMD